MDNFNGRGHSSNVKSNMARREEDKTFRREPPIPFWLFPTPPLTVGGRSKESFVRRQPLPRPDPIYLSRDVLSISREYLGPVKPTHPGPHQLGYIVRCPLRYKCSRRGLGGLLKTQSTRKGFDFNAHHHTDFVMLNAFRRQSKHQ